MMEESVMCVKFVLVWVLGRQMIILGLRLKKFGNPCFNYMGLPQTFRLWTNYFFFPEDRLL